MFSGEDVHGIKAFFQGDFSYFIADSDNCPLYKPRSPHLLRCESQHRLEPSPVVVKGHAIGFTPSESKVPDFRPSVLHIACCLYIGTFRTGGVCSQTQLCQLRCLMTILDNYMFRPLLAIFRLSLRELKVLLYTMCARVMERSLHPG